jgi:hypothetical protein
LISATAAAAPIKKPPCGGFWSTVRVLDQLLAADAAALAASATAPAAAEAAASVAEAAAEGASIGAGAAAAGGGGGATSSFLPQAARETAATKEANRSDDFIIFPQVKRSNTYTGNCEFLLATKGQQNLNAHRQGKPEPFQCLAHDYKHNRYLP